MVYEEFNVFHFMTSTMNMLLVMTCVLTAGFSAGFSLFEIWENGTFEFARPIESQILIHN